MPKITKEQTENALKIILIAKEQLVHIGCNHILTYPIGTASDNLNDIIIKKRYHIPKGK